MVQQMALRKRYRHFRIALVPRDALGCAVPSKNNYLTLFINV